MGLMFIVLVMKIVLEQFFRDIKRSYRKKRGNKPGTFQIYIKVAYTFRFKSHSGLKKLQLFLSPAIAKAIAFLQKCKLADE